MRFLSKSLTICPRTSTIVPQYQSCWRRGGAVEKIHHDLVSVTHHFENLFSVAISKFLPCLNKRVARLVLDEIFREGNRVRITETSLYIVHPLYNTPWLLSPKIGPDLWTITRSQCIDIRFFCEPISRI